MPICPRLWEATTLVNPRTVAAIAITFFSWSLINEKPSPSARGLVYYTISRLASDSVHDLGGDDPALI